MAPSWSHHGLPSPMPPPITPGHGTYSFIPDALIVGTVFVNTVANVLSTFTQSAKALSLPP